MSAQSPLRTTAIGESRAPGRSRKGRLLLASNREPFRVTDDGDGSGRCVPSMGGLASGLAPLLRQNEGVWVCWDPEPRPDVDETGRPNEPIHDGPFPMLQIGLRPSEVRDYYNGFCNRVLWPLCHTILGRVLGADAVGFHTAAYAVRFIESCGELLDCDIDSNPGAVIHGDHTTLVRARPIGIDAKSFARLAEDPDIIRRAIQLRRQFACDCLMLSVDRLDYTKGLVERVEAIHELFSRLPQCRGIVTFVQIAVPTRTEIPDYHQYRARFESAVRIVNETFGTQQWQPIVCRTEALSRRELVAHYLAADVACVTPVADGMNLVALEYCATRIANDGVLVLSRQAGASVPLGESAVTVDVRSTESVVGGLVQALMMPGAERARRMAQLRSVVIRSTSEQWLHRCLNDIEPAASEVPRSRTVN